MLRILENGIDVNGSGDVRRVHKKNVDVSVDTQYTYMNLFNLTFTFLCLLKDTLFDLRIRFFYHVDLGPGPLSDLSTNSKEFSLQTFIICLRS